MKHFIIFLLFPLFFNAQQCYLVKEITSSANITEISQKRIIFGVKQMTEEVLSTKYNLCQDGLPITVDIFSIEAPSQSLSLGPFAKKKKQTIVKVKLIIDGKELYGEGLAETSSQSMFLDMNDENLPFNKTTFASAVKKALEDVK